MIEQTMRRGDYMRCEKRARTRKNKSEASAMIIGAAHAAVSDDELSMARSVLRAMRFLPSMGFDLVT